MAGWVSDQYEYPHRTWYLMHVMVRNTVHMEKCVIPCGSPRQILVVWSGLWEFTAENRSLINTASQESSMDAKSHPLQQRSRGSY